MIRGKKLAVIGEQRVQIAQHAVLQQLANHVILRRVVAPHRLHRQRPLLHGLRFQRRAFPPVQRKRLFNQHMFARLQHPQPVGKVVVMRRGNVNRINIRSRQHLIHLSVSLRDPPAGGEIVGFLLRARGDGNHPLAAELF